MHLELVLMLLAAFVGFLAYMLPTWVAIGREHQQMEWIAFINLFLGWTVVGWVAALMWAMPSTADKRAKRAKA